MKKSILLIVVLLPLITGPVLANELLVLSGDKSQNSERWQEEVLPEYASTENGKTLPAKIVPVQGANFPTWFSEAMEDGRAGEILGTPTFIIWDEENKKELGRVEGYTKKSRFYFQLNEAMSMVEKGVLAPGHREGSGGHMREEGSGGDRRREGSSGNQNVIEHMYKTPGEAKKASEMLGLGGEIHSHESPEGTIYMPGSTM